VYELAGPRPVHHSPIRHRNVNVVYCQRSAVCGFFLSGAGLLREVLRFFRCFWGDTMSFRDFDLPKAQQDFGLTLATSQPLFANVLPVPISEGLRQFWGNIQPLGLSLVTEKARSELLVAPLLAEIWHRSGRRIALLSGVEFNVDVALGLNGTCDFLLCRSDNLYFVSAPLLVAVEAKRDSIPDGLGQCAAEMVAAQRFNQQANKPIDPIYGCVTTGSAWKFLRLTGQHLDIDINEYNISQPDRILGVLLHCCGVTI
jgi:hypothetical protein